MKAQLLPPLALLVALTAAAPARADTHRIAVVVGNNAGAGDRPALRYAEADAQKMARVLREVGGVEAADLFVLQGRGPAELERTVLQARQRVAEAHAVPHRRALLLFYFSGHGDGEALQLGKEQVSFAALKALLQGTGADVRLTVIDACQSGAAVLQKGGARAQTFSIKVANQLAVSGEVFITSTAPFEPALESSELSGSFFTNHLVSGLRGAADFSGDREVTLSEAYRYAYERTVAATSVTPAGTQHPSYKYALSGQGELVLTSLSRAPAQLTLPSGAERLLVTDVARGQVVAEVLSGDALTLALAPGQYTVKAVRQGRTVAARLELGEGARRSIGWEELDSGSRAQLASRGPAPAPPDQAAAAVRRGPVPDGALRICVLPFKNLTGDASLQYLSDALPEAVATDFGAQKGVRLVERGQLQLDLQELEFSASKYVDPRTRAELGRLHGAEVVVLGSYQRAGKTMRVVGRFVQVETGEILYTVKLERPAAGLLEVQDALAEQVREAIPVLRERLRR